ncbi:MAG: hypothetical protein Q4B86_07120 [Eubacteriales bacterium]|nr:hypothetical protein [Eubacteriales bacterium]
MTADYSYSNGFTEEEKEEISQELDLMLSLIQGSVPMSRDLGLDPEILDNGMADGGNLIIAELMDKIELMDCRLIVKEVKLSCDHKGIINTSIVLERRI